MADPDDSRLSPEIFPHISAISAAMLGVCLTAISLIRVVITFRHENTLADDLVCGDAILFLVAALSSYWLQRKIHYKRSPVLEAVADIAFVAGMIVMVGLCIFITYAISAT